MFTFKVIPDDGDPFMVTARSRDVRLWERTNMGARFSGLSDASIVDYEGVAFSAAKRQGLYTGTRESWDDSVDIDIVTEDEDADPTKPEA